MNTKMPKVKGVLKDAVTPKKQRKIVGSRL